MRPCEPFKKEKKFNSERRVNDGGQQVTQLACILALSLLFSYTYLPSGDLGGLSVSSEPRL